MSTSNKLTQTFASSSLAIGVATLASLAGTTFLAPSAQAVNVAYTSGTGFATTTVGDKIYTFVSGNAPSGTISLDFFTLPTDDLYTFRYTPSSPFNPATPVTLKYTVAIIPASPNFFKGVSLGVDVPGSASQVQVTAGVVPNVGSSFSLVSNAGAADGPNPTAPLNTIKSLTVTNTIAATGGSAIVNSVSNTFTQSTPRASVPEPSAVLSLLALGGLGLVSLKRKLG
jgi:hypothetical protein